MEGENWRGTYYNYLYLTISDPISLSSFMNGLSKRSLEVSAWHLCKCIVDVWSQYKDIEALRTKSTFMYERVC